MIDHFALVPIFGEGRGRLARHGRATVYVVANPSTTAQIASWCSFVGARPARDVLDELSQLLGHGAPTAVAAFVQDESGVEMLRLGQAPLRIDGEPVAPASTVQRSRLRHLDTISLLDPPAGHDLHLLDFAQGIVAADGFVLRLLQRGPAPWSASVIVPVQPESEPLHDSITGSPLPPPPPSSTPAAVAAPNAPTPPAAAPTDALVDVISLRDTDSADGGDLPTGAPLPVISRAGPTERPTPVLADPHQVIVSGLRCARGHFNDPRARFCAVCGIAMHQASFVLTSDVRPALGVITFADGAIYSVIRDLVFGREPDDAPKVKSGAALAAVLLDPAGTISRVHAEVVAKDWDLYLVDRSSTNGTFVWISADQRWDRLVPDHEYPIHPGAQLSFGGMFATYDSRLRPAQ